MKLEPTIVTSTRRNAHTTHIDSQATEDMLTLINQEDKHISDAITPWLPAIARLVDSATASLSNGGRLVIIGAGQSGRSAMLAASEFAPGGKSPVLGIIAGGAQAMLNQVSEVAQDYERGIRDLKAVGFNERDMLLALSVGGKTPWVWGALRHAWSINARRAVITANGQSEAAHLCDITIAPLTGAEVVAGFGNPKAITAQNLILNMVSTALAVRSGRVFSNLRVDLEANGTQMQERQIAIVMEAGDCNRQEAKTALAGANHHCKTAILMVLAGVDAQRAESFLAENNGYIRLALQGAHTPA